MDEEDTTNNTTTSSANTAEKDQVVGGVEQAKGRVKESAGALTGNERLKTEGRDDQLAGTAHSKKGQFKERLKAWIDRF